ncbi:PREDICTED: uncharacterized protein LOC109213625 [Nicotiana attenuata]|uniref:uncharacterized protein LOC109213625 n=1 Tax=Nicotiana attenuata TaxID=49451 RepID=UPI0009052203|nr:PREDICTED: uncharacterized protein LOC109213625 [Nicotiana attenuata]
MEDIKEEINYWESAVECYILGSNPPQAVMDGYFRRIWGKIGVDKVAQTSKGVFIVRFHNIVDRNKVIEEGVQMFDKKPVIIRAWTPDMEFTKTQMEKIPVWVRLPGPEIKYWGKIALTKIARMIGKPLKADNATTHRERLTYARVLVEVELNNKYQNSVMFENEHGRIIEQEVVYEWKPVLCEKCDNYGHEMKECRKWIKEEKEKQKAHEVTNNEQGKGNIQNKGIDNGKQKVAEANLAKDTGLENKQNKQIEGKGYQAKYKTGKYIAKGATMQNTTLKLGNTFSSLMEQQTTGTRPKEPSSSIP